MLKRYYIQKEKVDEVVEQFGQVTGYKIENKEIPGSKNIWRQLKITHNDNKATLTIYKNKKNENLFSLVPNSKKEAEELQRFILDHTEFEETDIKKNSFTDVSDEDFEVIKEYLLLEEKLKIKKCECTDTYIKERIKITNADGLDEITLTLYNNKRLLFQGKPYQTARTFYSVALLILEKDEDQKNYLSLFQNDVCDVIEQDFKKLLPNVYEKLPKNMLTVLSTSIILINKKQKLDDYSCYIMNACRVVEGVLKSNFKKMGIHIKRSTGFRDHFMIEDKKVVMNEKTIQKGNINSKEESDLIEAYRFLYTYRNSAAHYDIIDLESNIMEYEDAVNVVTDACKLINDIYKEHGN